MSYTHLEPITFTEVLGLNASDVCAACERDAGRDVACSKKILNPKFFWSVLFSSKSFSTQNHTGMTLLKWIKISI